MSAEPVAPGWPGNAMVEAAWGLLANVNWGDWSLQPTEWREAAERWREAYHAAPTSPAVPSGELSTAAITDAQRASVLDMLYKAAEREVRELIEDAEGLHAALSWALDILDMYDERLAAIDGHDVVYTTIHLAGKAKARGVLAALRAAQPSGLDLNELAERIMLATDRLVIGDDGKRYGPRILALLRESLRVAAPSPTSQPLPFVQVGPNSTGANIPSPTDDSTEAWRLAALKVLDGFARGVFVRSVDGDGDPAWAIGLLPYLKAMADLQRWAIHDAPPPASEPELCDRLMGEEVFGDDAHWRCVRERGHTGAHRYQDPTSEPGE